MTNDSSDGSVPIIQGVGDDGRSRGMSAAEKLRALANRMCLQGIAVAPGDAGALNELLGLVEDVTRPVNSTSPHADLVEEMVEAAARWLGVSKATFDEFSEGRTIIRAVLSALAARGVGEARMALPQQDALIESELDRTNARHDDYRAHAVVKGIESVLDLCVARLAPILAAKDARIADVEQTLGNRLCELDVAKEQLGEINAVLDGIGVAADISALRVRALAAKLTRAEVERDAALARVAELERELEPSSRRG